jgi:hypothetical protein
VIRLRRAGGQRIGDPHAGVDAVDEHGGGLPGQRGGDPLPVPGGYDAGVQLGLHLVQQRRTVGDQQAARRTSCSACETKSAVTYAGSAESSASTPISVPPQSVMPPVQAATASRMHAYCGVEGQVAERAGASGALLSLSPQQRARPGRR